MNNTRINTRSWGELKWYGKIFDELCFLVIGFDRGQQIPRTTIHFAPKGQAHNGCHPWILDSGCSYLVKRRRAGDG